MSEFLPLDFAHFHRCIEEKIEYCKDFEKNTHIRVHRYQSVNFDDGKTSALKLCFGQKKITEEEELAKPKKEKSPKDNLNDSHQESENNDFWK